MLGFSDSCVFCVSRGERFGTTSDFKRLVGGLLGSRVVYETENFAVLPSLGQIVEGYLLIMPKVHYKSFALLDSALYDEAEEVYQATKDVLARVYRSPVLYEHGMGYSESGNGCCVDHAHIHAIPASVKLAELLRSRFRWKRIKSLSDLSMRVRGSPYLFVEDSSGDKDVYYARDLRAQYIRHMVADLLGTPERGDWMLYPGVDELLRTVTKLSFWSQEKRVPRTVIPFQA